jgi:hypothetical protein
MLRNNFTALHPVMGMKPLVDPASAPTWMSSAAINRYTDIPGTSGAGGTAINAYSGMLLGQDLKLRIALAGGHGDSSDNRVAQIDLSVNAPTGWTTLSAASLNKPSPAGSLARNAAYYYDDAGGTTNPKPGSRHTYSNMTALDEVGNRIFAVGYFATYPDASIWNLIDAFDLGTNTWASPDTWPRTGTATGRTEFSGIVSGFVYHDKTANLVYWKSDNFLWRLNLATGVRTQLSSLFDTVSGFGYGGWEALGRYPIAFSVGRNEFFSLQWGNGQGVGTGLTAGRILNPSSGSPTFNSITLASSAGLTALQACKPWYASMSYDELRSRYVFTAGGNGDDVGSITSTDWTKVFEIVPNGTTTWDVVQATFASTAVLPGSVPLNGIHGRMQYIQRGGIGGFVVLANASDTLKFYRTT